MSGKSDTPQMKSKKRTSRTAPSIRLNVICPPRAGFIFLISVAASSGRYLYMKMKKASERMTFAAASHPLRVAAFSRDRDFDVAAGTDAADEAAVSSRFVVESA